MSDKNLNSKCIAIISVACLLSIIVALSSCSSMSNLPEQANVKVSREDAANDCIALGKLEGRSRSVKGTNEDALNDLKQEAANKGANYLVVKEYSSNGTTVSGLAYNCP